MHGPRRANQETIAGLQSASPLETPPHGAGIDLEHNGPARQSANETATMRRGASKPDKN